MKFAMKSALQNEHISPRRFTRLYITALSSIAIFCIIGQILIQISLLQASDDARVINIAGRQRMLSLKLTMATSALVIPTDPIGREKRLPEIQKTLSSLELEHIGLINGDATLSLPGHNSPTIMQDFDSMQADFDAITAAAKDILDKLNKNQAAPNSELQADVNTILAHEEPFVTMMNTTVGHFQHEAENRVASLKVEEVILCILTLMVLVLEALFIFHPAIRKLHMSITQLVEAEKHVAANTAELERKNTDLELAFQEAMIAHRKVMPHARVVTYGHYQVQASNNNYYSVKTRDVNGNQHLECECLMYRRNMICSHSLAAAAMHSALLRNQRQNRQQSSDRRVAPSFSGPLTGTSEFNDNRRSSDRRAAPGFSGSGPLTGTSELNDDWQSSDRRAAPGFSGPLTETSEFNDEMSG
jgi:nitrate/nitrite-specific signal transduction histidine kinase